MDANERFELMADEFHKKTNLIAPGKSGFDEFNFIDRAYIVTEWNGFCTAYNERVFSAHYEMCELLESIRENYGANDALGIEIDKVLSKARGE